MSSSGFHADPDKFLEDCRAAVAADLDYIFSRVGARRREKNQEGFVKYLVFLKIEKVPDHGLSRQNLAPKPIFLLEYSFGNAKGVFPAQPDDPDSSEAGRRRDCDNRIIRAKLEHFFNFSGALKISKEYLITEKEVEKNFSRQSGPSKAGI